MLPAGDEVLTLDVAGRVAPGAVRGASAFCFLAGEEEG